MADEPRWRIKSLLKQDNRGRAKYWSESVGWTWIDFAEVYTEAQKGQVLVPREGVWEEVGPD